MFRDFWVELSQLLLMNELLLSLELLLLLLLQKFFLLEKLLGVYWHGLQVLVCRGHVP